MTITIEHILAVGTLVNACVVTYFIKQQVNLAKRQRELEEAKHRAELYERRMCVFKSVQKALSTVMTKGTCDYSDALALDENLQLSIFLFEDEIYEYIRKVRHEMIKLASSSQRMQEHRGEDRSQIIAENQSALIWLTDELGKEGLFLKFKPFLRH